MEIQKTYGDIKLMIKLDECGKFCKGFDLVILIESGSLRCTIDLDHLSIDRDDLIESIMYMNRIRFQGPNSDYLNIYFDSDQISFNSHSTNGDNTISTSIDIPVHGDILDDFRKLLQKIHDFQEEKELSQ